MSGNAHAALVRDRAVDLVTMKLAHRLRLVIASCSTGGPNTSLRMMNAPSTTGFAPRWLMVVTCGCRVTAACAGSAVQSTAAIKANAVAIAGLIVGRLSFRVCTGLAGLAELLHDRPGHRLGRSCPAAAVPPHDQSR